MIRLILIATILILYLIIGIPVLLIEWVIGKFNPRARDISSLRMVQAAFKLMLWITGSDITYIGHENVPKDQAVLYVGNHCSYFDILLTYSQCPDLTGYVAKAEMLKYPLLRDWMKRLYCLFLDRSDMRAGMQMILTGIDYIKKGISICIFPEGTRSRMGNQLLPFKGGTFKSAVRAKCPIVPCALIDSYKPFDEKSIAPVTVKLIYLPPICYEEYKQLKTPEIADIVKTKIEEAIRQYS